MTRTTRIAGITCPGTGGLGVRSGGRSGRGPRVPPPPWAREPPKPGKAEREQAKRADARAERLHLVGLTNAAVIVMGVVLGAVRVPPMCSPPDKNA